MARLIASIEVPDLPAFTVPIVLTPGHGGGFFLGPPGSDLVGYDRDGDPTGLSFRPTVEQLWASSPNAGRCAFAGASLIEVRDASGRIVWQSALEAPLEPRGALMFDRSGAIVWLVNGGLLRAFEVGSGRSLAAPVAFARKIGLWVSGRGMPVQIPGFAAVLTDWGRDGAVLLVDCSLDSMTTLHALRFADGELEVDAWTIPGRLMPLHCADRRLLAMRGQCPRAKLAWVAHDGSARDVTVKAAVYACEPAGARAHHFAARSFDKAHLHDASTLQELAWIPFRDAECGHGAITIADRDRLLVALPPPFKHPFEPRHTEGSKLQLWALRPKEPLLASAPGETTNSPERWIEEGEDD